MNNKIFSAVKFGDAIVHFCAGYRSEIRFVISTKLSEEQAHIQYKASAVGRFIGAAGRQPETKAYSSLSVDTFRVLGRKKRHILPNVSIALSVQLTYLLSEGPWSAVVGVSVLMYRKFCCENLFSL